MSFAHVWCRSITVNVHRRADVRVTHETLLHADRRTDGIKPRAVCVPECVAPKMPDPCGVSGALQFLLYSGVGVRQSANLDRRSKNPILIR